MNKLSEKAKLNDSTFDLIKLCEAFKYGILKAQVNKNVLPPRCLIDVGRINGDRHPRARCKYWRYLHMDSLTLFDQSDNTPEKTCTGPCGRTLPATTRVLQQKEKCQKWAECTMQRILSRKEKADYQENKDEINERRRENYGEHRDEINEERKSILSR